MIIAGCTAFSGSPARVSLENHPSHPLGFSFFGCLFFAYVLDFLCFFFLAVHWHCQCHCCHLSCRRPFFILLICFFSSHFRLFFNFISALFCSAFIFSFLFYLIAICFLLARATFAAAKFKFFFYSFFWHFYDVYIMTSWSVWSVLFGWNLMAGRKSAVCLQFNWRLIDDYCIHFSSCFLGECHLILGQYLGKMEEYK